MHRFTAQDAAERAPFLAAEFEGLARRILDDPPGGGESWFIEYCGSLQRPDQVGNYIRYHLDNVAFHGRDPRGCDVLDAGCGFGMGLVVHGLMDARSLHGIDITPEMLETIEAYRPLLPGRIAERLAVTRASTADMPFPDGSFDLVLSYEAISHYNDVEAFIAESFRVLRPGGVLMISDGNNGANPVIRRRTRRIWEVVENGPPGTRIGPHHVIEPMVRKRARFLRERVPGMPPDDAERLALVTSGMAGDDLAEAGRRFLSDGTTPGRVYAPGDLPVEPEKGEVIERLFDPFALGRVLEQAGFRATSHGYWGGANGRPVVRRLNRLLSSMDPVLAFTARAFRVAAVKTS